MTLRFKKQGLSLLLSGMEPQQIKALRNVLKPSSSTSQELRTPTMEVSNGTLTQEHVHGKRKSQINSDNSKKKKEAGTGVEADTLTDDQEAVLARVRAGKNVFFTGSAGTGKSKLLHIIREMIGTSEVAFTAPTGIAACNIGGVTIHSFAGLTLQPGSVEQRAKSCANKPHIAYKWTRTKTLVIDEVSMLG